MADKKAPPQQASSQPIEYSIYTMLWPKGGDKKAEWEKVKTSEDQDGTLGEAMQLFQSGDFLKVEVKKKYFEEKTGRTIEMSLRLFENKVKKDFTVPLLIVLAIACGGGAFAATFFLL